MDEKRKEDELQDSVPIGLGQCNLVFLPLFWLGKIAKFFFWCVFHPKKAIKGVLWGSIFIFVVLMVIIAISEKT